MRSFHFILLLFGCFVTLTGIQKNKQAASFIPFNLKCEYRADPMGIDVLMPHLEWILIPTDSSLRALSQTAYQILVASSKEILRQNKGDLWNTGQTTSGDINNIPYQGRPLKSHQTVWWKVRVWDQNKTVSAWSDASQWTMGILHPQDWSGAKWIGGPEKLDSAINSTFLLRREFTVKQGLKRAIISICGLGQYEMTLNGKPLTETLLNPGWTQYNKTCLYDTYDITGQLTSGQNAIGLLLANGMYRVKKGGRYAKLENNFGRLQAIAKIQLEYNNGSIETLTTDDRWKAGKSAMIWSSIYGGEDWDARDVERGWDNPGFNDSLWLPVEIRNGPGGQLKGLTHAAPPVRTFGVFGPTSKKEIKPNFTIYDLGQNASYISRLTARGRAGSKVKITPGELLNPDGTLFRNNYNGRSYSVYTLAGGGTEIYTSKFFNTGCRYYEVECIPAPGNNQVPSVELIEGIVVHSASTFAGEFSCSNSLFNRIFTMIKWAELSNMKSVISDCPHRERLGWLEQSHLHGPSFRYNYDMRPLVGKIIHDMNDTQQPNGLVPCIAPELTVFGSDWREAIEWGTAGVMLPWQQYEWTGNPEILRNNYPMMKKYVDYLTSKARDGIAAPGKGDWCGRRASPHTPRELIATAFYYANADVLARSARLMGNTAEAEIQGKLAKKIYDVFNKKFFNPTTKQYGDGSQCANGMALVLGLVTPQHRSAVLNNLVADIENRRYENTTGEVGMRYMLRALADGGRSDVIYRLNNQDQQPGYGYQLKLDATALPETWDAYRDNSQNQFMLGHIVEWFYHDLVGIQMDSSKPGFKHFIIRPDIVEDLAEVKGSYHSLHGKIVSEWKRNGNQVTLHVVIPPHATATIFVPAKDVSAVTENSMPIKQIRGGKLAGWNGSYAIVKIGSGDYTFVSFIQ
ncbi:MAG: family 78 glycoside hydrolase catalytic domain [Chitinophagaceae bacterium]|nr:family 78 glycoside hydrolase catalytic domain [Chitinophagaceae bacterium]